MSGLLPSARQALRFAFVAAGHSWISSFPVVPDPGGWGCRQFSQILRRFFVLHSPSWVLVCVVVTFHEFRRLLAFNSPFVGVFLQSQAPFCEISVDSSPNPPGLTLFGVWVVAIFRKFCKLFVFLLLFSYYGLHVIPSFPIHYPFLFLVFLKLVCIGYTLSRTPRRERP